MGKTHRDEGFNLVLKYLFMPQSSWQCTLLISLTRFNGEFLKI